MPISRNRDIAGSIGQAVALDKITAAGGLAAGLTVYANVSAMPTSGPSVGDQAFVSANNKIYVWNGSGWFSVATVNQSPTWSTEPGLAYALATNGSATSITVEATDPDGFPITYSYSTSGLGNIATISQGGAGNRTYTITPSTNTDHAGAFTMTFTATDGINTLSKSGVSFTLVFITKDSNKTELLLKATGTGANTTPTDASASSHSLVMNGATASLGTFSPYKASGYSMYFDGNGDYITAPNSDDFTLTGIFTIEMFVYLDQTTYARTVQRIITPSTGNPAVEPYISIGNDQGGVNAGCLCFTSSVAAGNPQGYATVEGTGATGTNLYFPFKKWTHVALTRDGSNVCRLFQDGIKVATVTISGGFDFNGANNGGITIGKSGWNNSEPVGPVYIADFHMMKGTAKYSTNFNPPEDRLTIDNNTKLLLGASGFYDKSAGRHVISVNGDTYIDQHAPYDVKSYSASDHGGSAHFPGTSDEIKTSDGSSNEVVLGTGDFTVELWLYKHTAVSTFWEAILSQMYTATGGWRLYKTDASGNLNWYEATTNVLTPTIPIKRKEWTHIAFVRNSGTLYCYINGKAAGSVSSSYNYTGGTNGEIEIGKGTYASSLPIDCNISDVRIVVGTPVYTGVFTPPSGPLTTTGGTYPSSTNVNTSFTASHTKLLLNMTQGSIRDDSQKSHSLTLAGNAVASSTQQHFSENTLYIENGDADFVEISEEGKQLTIYDDDYTVETWLYPTNFNASYNYFISKGTSPSAREWAFSISASDIRVYWSTNGASSGDTTIVGTVSNSLNEWVNLTFTKIGDNVSIYKNGTHITSGAFNSIYSGDAKLTIGRLWQYTGISHSYDGYIHDLRVSKGITRYPFVPLKETLTTTNSQRDGVTVTASNVTLLTCHAATITDGSSNGTSITTNGNAVVSDWAPASGMKSVYFDGTGDYLQCTLADTLGTNDWTIEYWVYHNNTSANQIHCAFNGYAPAFYYRNSSNAFAVYHASAGISGNYNPNITPVVNKWYHMAYCHDDSENKMTIFINGAQADEFTYTGNISGTTFRIGDDGTSAWMNGFISNLRIVKDTVVYSKNFTPTTSSLLG